MDAMIKAAITLDPTLMSKLEELAIQVGQQGAQPANFMAGFLVGSIPAHIESPEEEGDYDGHSPPTAEQWEYFLVRCREATKDAERYGSVTNPEYLARCARIGQWPSEIPLHGTEGFLQMSYSTAWLWAWTQDKKCTDAFINNGQLPIWRPANHNNGWIVAEGLLEAIHWGVIKVPPERRVPFAVSYGQWMANVRVANAGISSLCHWGLHFDQEI